MANPKKYDKAFEPSRVSNLEEKSIERSKASKELMLAKKQEKEKLKNKTHRYVVSEDGKTRTLKKINNQ